MKLSKLLAKLDGKTVAKIKKIVAALSESEIVSEMAKEYHAIPEEFKDVLKEGGNVRLWMTRNLTDALTKSWGWLAKIRKVYPFGLKIKARADLVNNRILKGDFLSDELQLDEQERHVFITSPSLKGVAFSGYIHYVPRDAVREQGTIYVGSMSSHVLPPKSEGVEETESPEEYYQFPAPFLKLKKGHLIFVHKHENLDAVFQGMDLLTRADLISIKDKSLMEVKTVKPLKKDTYVFLGAAGLGTAIANCYVHDVKGNIAYIGCMSNYLVK